MIEHSVVILNLTLVEDAVRYMLCYTACISILIGLQSTSVPAKVH